jgi:hypothetical protein
VSSWQTVKTDAAHNETFQLPEVKAGRAVLVCDQDTIAEGVLLAVLCARHIGLLCRIMGQLERGLLYFFGFLNVSIVLVIVWKLSSLEGLNTEGRGNSPVAQVRQILANEKLQQEIAEANAKPKQEEEEEEKKEPPPLPRPIIRNRVAYGIFTAKKPNRTPTVMIMSRLTPEVHDRFLKSPMFTSNESELVKFGLKKTIDYPKSKDIHTYYEGYFHALPQSSTYYSRNPRHGKNFDKSPAGDFLRAFYEGFRRANNATFETLRRRLWFSAVSRHPRFPQNDTCGHVARWLERGFHFADLSVQIHWGSHIKGPELFWHSDAENSLLHFCVTVSGKRILHSMRSLTVAGEVREVLEDVSAGDMYLATSTFMNHAPEYPAVSFDNRIAAIQARFIYTTEELKAFRASGGPDSPAWRDLTKIITEQLSIAKLEVPSTALIDRIIAERRAGK